jgi:phage terminase large subunit
VDGGLDVLDCYESHGKPLSHYFDVVAARGYDYRRHWLPHDARAHTLASGTSILDQCVNHFESGAVAIGPELSLLDGIQSARWLLQQNIRFHRRCAEGIEALRQYHYPYDEAKKNFGAQPVHDWTSHYADGFRYMAIVAKVTKQLVEKAPPPPPPVESPFSLDAMWDAQPERSVRI